jgi:hypothetical protein
MTKLWNTGPRARGHQRRGNGWGYRTRPEPISAHGRAVCGAAIGIPA